jgi:lipopolysaccharide cholinephosphotransferase
LNILKHIDSFCAENGIKYFLSGGTMLGAVRHHGYIPWDDDIDIMMLRKDYDHFIKIYSEQNNESYGLRSNIIDSNFPFTFSKIEDKRTLLKENTEEKVVIGVNIDVFPIDTVPEDIKLQKKMYKKFERLRNFLLLKTISTRKGRFFMKNILLVFSHIILKVVSTSFLIKKIEENAIKYKMESSKYCGVVVWGYGIKEINLLSNWRETVMMKFEDMNAPVPIGYDNYLTSLYGDYMQLPPEEKRITHHSFEAYWK